jgi:hypothetical protein
MKSVDDPTAFRVTLICPCANDAAEGYGSTAGAARRNAFRFYNREHRGQTPKAEILERVTADGSHYEEIS